MAKSFKKFFYLNVDPKMKRNIERHLEKANANYRILCNVVGGDGDFEQIFFLGKEV